ncbi:hypothetical protein D9611_014187 [Ephemerocybe angulata]|uniref:Uncharacterized protein n=1 Tax=Ephemerocybe angulata TaxID=980116 RepID=A0A8H5FII4_9AGAR|nr:hypothetical protein D9611_014187 [Tulosesus angulatus]
MQLTHKLFFFFTIAASWILGALAIPVRPQLTPIDTSGREQNNDWWDKLPSGKEEPVTPQSANCAGKDCYPKLQNSKTFRLPPKESPWAKIKKGFNTVLSKVGLRPKTTTGRNVPARSPTRSGGAVPKAPASVNVKKPGPAKKGGNRSNAKGAQGSRGGKAGGPRKAAPVKGKGKAPTRKAAPSKAQARPAAPRKARAPGKAKPAGRK